jgi:uncharacterized membrane protein YdcZ (DUF606 family)
MKSRRITTSIKTILAYTVFVVLLIACENQQGMMHGGGDSTYMGNWNWIGILIGAVIVFLIGYLIARRRK